jgi:type IV secretion system protein VirD4
MGANHPAVKQYNKCMRGAGDTVRSIIISANSRLAFLENKQVLRLLSKDELNLADIGIGVNGDGETKTALFCVIPDSDKSYNFIIGMLYTQIFQELYYQADFNCGGRLPIHVTFMLDEFANVALPDDYCSLLSTMRSREISSIIIIQNFAQLKALFKDTWETIPGNCDTFIYLGGNEQSTHKYVSELLGKGTIDKKSSGETKGRQGSSSRNYDVLGREIFTPDEVRKLDNKKCIIFIRGFDPVLDNKYIPFKHPMFDQTADGKGKPYVHQIGRESNLIGPPFEILSKKAVEHYEKLQKKGENIYIDSLSYNEFMLLGELELSKRFSQLEEESEKDKLNRSQDNELEYSQETAEEVKDTDKKNEPDWEDNITNRMMHWSYTDEQKKQVHRAMANKLSKSLVLSFFYPKIPAEEMEKIISQYLADR